MRGQADAVISIFAIILLLSISYIATNAMVEHTLRMTKTEKDVITRVYERTLIDFDKNVDCSAGNVRISYSGRIPIYQVRLVCVDYATPNTVCVPPASNYSNAKSISMIDPAASPWIDYNISACGSQWTTACSNKTLRCYLTTVRAANPAVTG